MAQIIFSCVIPVKGTRPFMGETLQSLMDQGLGEELEIIIQDGDREFDCGQSDGLNKGFSKAQGEWLFWQNADDVLLPGALKKVLKYAEHAREMEWIAGDTVYLDEKGIVRDVRTDARWRPWCGEKMSVWTGGPSAFFRRSLWERLGGFDTSLKYVMDIDLWTRWAQAGVKYESLNDYIWGFRIHEGSKTASGCNKEAHFAERLNMLKNHGLSHQAFWRNVTRVVSILDGSWAKRRIDTFRFKGKYWSEIG